MERLQKAGNLGRKGIGFLLVFVGVLFQDWNLDSDSWFILNGGRYVMEQGIPHTEPFTMHEGLHFVLEQWLTGVIFWQVYDSFGSTGLLHLVFVVGCLLLYAYYRLCLLVSDGNRLVSILMGMTAGIMAYPSFLVTRPQIFSTLFFVVEVFLLESYARTRQWKWLLPLPLMSLFLVNLHAALWPMLLILLVPFLLAGIAGKWGLFPAGLPGSRFLLVSHLVHKHKNNCSRCDQMLGRGGRRSGAASTDDDNADGCISGNYCGYERGGTLGPLLWTAAGIFAAGFANPYGWEAMAFVFYSYDPSIHGRIAEIHPVTLHGMFGKFFFLWLLLLIIVESRKAMPLPYVLLTAGTALMSLLAMRSLFLFFFLGTFPMAYALRHWRSSLLSGGQGMGSPWRIAPFALLCLLAGYRVFREGGWGMVPMGPACLFALLCFFMVLYVFCYKEEEKRFSFVIPALRMKVAAVLLSLLVFFVFAIWQKVILPREDFEARYQPTVDFLLKQAPKEDIVLWTGFNTGAYPEFRGIRCYVDARPEVFLPSNTHVEHNIIKEYFDLVDGKIYYKDFFRQYAFTHVLTMSADGIVHAMLPHDDEFRLLYEQKDEDGNVVCRLFAVKAEARMP